MVLAGEASVCCSSHVSVSRPELPAGQPGPRTPGSPHKVGETAHVSHLPGDLQQAGGHPAVPTQPLQKVCLRALQGALYTPQNSVHEVVLYVQRQHSLCACNTKQHTHTCFLLYDCLSCSIFIFIVLFGWGCLNVCQ